MLQPWIDSVLQVVAVTHVFIVFFLGPIIWSSLMAYLFLQPVSYPYFTPLAIAYMIWVIKDRKTCLTTGRSYNWVRRSSLWKHFKDYFPQELVKTADLSPESNYIFCMFPHGIMCSGAWAHFIPESSQFTEQFPGLTVSCHTLNLNFLLPISREYTLALGLLSVSKEAILHQLNNRKGHAVNLVIGGSAEALLSHPGTYRVVLKNRKGFVKLALQTGTPLVPIFNFGEVDVYGQVMFEKGSFLYKTQEFIRRLTGAAPCLFVGRLPFFYLPKKVPVHTVVGRPIPVEKVDHPSQEEIDRLHSVFVQELVDLFDNHKHKYVAHPDKTFLSVETAP